MYSFIKKSYRLWDFSPCKSTQKVKTETARNQEKVIKDGTFRNIRISSYSKYFLNLPSSLHSLSEVSS